MNFIGKVSVFPKLPASIARLQELAYNLWWSWETEAQALFASIDPAHWEAVNHNPVRLLRTVQQARLDAAASRCRLFGRLPERPGCVRQLHEPGGRDLVRPDLS